MDMEISRISYEDMLQGRNDINLDHECHKLLSWRRVIRFCRACAVGDSILQTSERAQMCDRKKHVFLLCESVPYYFDQLGLVINLVDDTPFAIRISAHFRIASYLLSLGRHCFLYSLD